MKLSQQVRKPNRSLIRSLPRLLWLLKRCLVQIKFGPSKHDEYISFQMSVAISNIVHTSSLKLLLCGFSSHCFLLLGAAKLTLAKMHVRDLCTAMSFPWNVFHDLEFRLIVTIHSRQSSNHLRYHRSFIIISLFIWRRSIWTLPHLHRTPSREAKARTRASRAAWESIHLTKVLTLLFSHSLDAQLNNNPSNICLPTVNSPQSNHALLTAKLAKTRTLNSSAQNICRDTSKSSPTQRTKENPCNMVVCKKTATAKMWQQHC